MFWEELVWFFLNLFEFIEIYNFWCEVMKKFWEEGFIIKEISDFMLVWFDGFV